MVGRGKKEKPPRRIQAAGVGVRRRLRRSQRQQGVRAAAYAGSPALRRVAVGSPWCGRRRLGVAGQVPKEQLAQRGFNSLLDTGTSTNSVAKPTNRRARP